MIESSRSVAVVNELGVHARPAAAIVQVAAQYESVVEITKDGVTVNAKSILGVLMLAAEVGSLLYVSAQGNDAEQAVDAIVDLVAGGFPGSDLG